MHVSWKRDIRRKKKAFRVEEQNYKTTGISEGQSRGMTPMTVNFKREMVILVTCQLAWLFSKWQLYPFVISQSWKDFLQARGCSKIQKMCLELHFSLNLQARRTGRRGTLGTATVADVCHCHLSQGTEKPPGAQWPRLAGWPPPDLGQAETERFCALEELGLPVTQAKPSSRFPTRPRRSLAAALGLFFQVSRGCIKYWFLSCF